jgi:hypothetical protein
MLLTVLLLIFKAADISHTQQLNSTSCWGLTCHSHNTRNNRFADATNRQYD